MPNLPTVSTSRAHPDQIHSAGLKASVKSRAAKTQRHSRGFSSRRLSCSPSFRQRCWTRVMSFKTDSGDYLWAQTACENRCSSCFAVGLLATRKFVVVARRIQITRPGVHHQIQHRRGLSPILRSPTYSEPHHHEQALQGSSNHSEDKDPPMVLKIDECSMCDRQ